MKTVGLIGGMSWESTASYYQLINEQVKQLLGGLHSAKILLYSVDFAEVEEYQARGEWGKSAELLSDIALRLEKAGADYIVLCTNTMHKVAPEIEEKITVPMIHIAEATAKAIKNQKFCKVGLLGTKYTMLQDFYKQRLIDNGIEVIIPSQADIEIVNDVIYNELCLGRISASSREKYVGIVEKMQNFGAEGVILGCTEIGLLLSQEDVKIPVFDTAVIHACEAARIAVAE